MNAFERWSLWTTSVLTGVTGIGYFWTKHLSVSSDPFSVVNHPLQPWFLKVHILVSPLLLVAVGSVLVRHIWKHYRLGVVLGRRSGLLTAAVFFPMAASGYFVQTAVSPVAVQVLAWTHIVTSAAYLVGIALHQVFVHRRGRDEKVSMADGPGQEAELLRARARAQV